MDMCMATPTKIIGNGAPPATAPEKRQTTLSSQQMRRTMKEFNDIFDAVIFATGISIRQDRINRKKSQINSVTDHRCGNCTKWMTSACVPEMNTRRIMSMNDGFGCKYYDYKESFLLERFKRELLGLEDDLMAYKQGAKQ